jgi:hypothetical protein
MFGQVWPENASHVYDTIRSFLLMFLFISMLVLSDDECQWLSSKHGFTL